MKQIPSRMTTRKAKAKAKAWKIRLLVSVGWERDEFGSAAIEGFDVVGWGFAEGGVFA